MEVSGTIHFRTDEVAYAVGVSLLFSMLGLFRSEVLSTHQRRLEVATLLALAVCGLLHRHGGPEY